MEEWEEMYFKLQNGSDIRGVSVEGVEGEPVNLTSEIARNIAVAFVDFLADKKGIPYEQIQVGIGHDSRISAEELKKGVVNGVMTRGCKAYD